MEDALKQLVPIFAFMLIPVWIPLIAATVAGVGRMLRLGRPTTGAAASVIRAKQVSQRKHLAQPLATVAVE